MKKLITANAAVVLVMCIWMPTANAETNGGEVIVNTGTHPCSGLAGYDLGEFLATGECKCPLGESAYNDEVCIFTFSAPPPDSAKPPPGGGGGPGPGSGNNNNNDDEDEEEECTDCDEAYAICVGIAGKRLVECRKKKFLPAFVQCASGFSRDPSQYGTDYTRWGNKDHQRCMKSHLHGVPGRGSGSTSGGWSVNAEIDLKIVKGGGGYNSGTSNDSSNTPGNPCGYIGQCQDDFNREVAQCYADSLMCETANANLGCE